MPHIRVPRSREIPEREATPERVYLSRRRFLQGAGLAALGAAAACRRSGGAAGEASGAAPGALPHGSGLPEDVVRMYPAARSAAYALDRAVTDERVAGRYNNFYEFTEEKELVAAMAAALTLRPWTIQIAGLVAEPRTVDVDDIVRKMGLEERLYRHRCVEAWSMAVPWTGFPLARFVDFCAPLGAARHVRFVSFLRPEEAPGQRKPWYPWPYFEALRLDEAVNELALLATGIYGHPLPPQHGAPVRLVAPWKYGFKSIKSVVRVEFTAERPGTFWSAVSPAEYDFLANVDPAVPHPRWSQTSERLIDTGERVPTLPYNGYAEQVAGLYGPGSSTPQAAARSTAS
jgi:sulfoxide reductase catalytic subunit YedY